MTHPRSSLRPIERSRGGATSPWLIALAVLAVLALVGYSIFSQVNSRSIPEDLASDVDHFKYGSIGSDTPDGNGLPYWVWRAMPQVCPDLLPGGYASLGIIQEPGRDRPIGFSKRRTGFVDSLGLNCAICHTARVREAPGSAPLYYLAATSHQLDLWGYFNFIFSCGQDERFNEDNVMSAIEDMTDLGLVDKIIYRIAIGEVKKGFETRAPALAWIPDRPLWGPGRVDTFNPYKTLVFGLDMSNDTSIGTADFMTVWNQRGREGMWVHWDGNNSSVDERNRSAAIGAGATPESIDLTRIDRIKAWIMDLQAPPYPFEIDQAMAAKGKYYYDEYCAACHDFDGPKVGKVVSNKYLGTDPERVDAFDDKMAEYMNTIGEGYDWQFRNFRTTDGYANHPLDGVWLRAPYLHNGSVPTLRDLLEKPEGRPVFFYKGYDVFDKQEVGYVSDLPKADGVAFFKFDTRLRGNGNGGHLYGTDLTDEQKDALVEYMKTL